jgi:hypothetical protein
MTSLFLSSFAAAATAVAATTAGVYVLLWIYFGGIMCTYVML